MQAFTYLWKLVLFMRFISVDSSLCPWVGFVRVGGMLCCNSYYNVFFDTATTRNQNQKMSNSTHTGFKLIYFLFKKHANWHGIKWLSSVFPTFSCCFLCRILGSWTSASPCADSTMNTWSTWASPALCLNCRVCLPLTVLSWLLCGDHRTNWTDHMAHIQGLGLYPVLSTSEKNKLRLLAIKLLTCVTQKEHNNVRRAKNSAQIYWVSTSS